MDPGFDEKIKPPNLPMAPNTPLAPRGPSASHRRNRILFLIATLLSISAFNSMRRPNQLSLPPRDVGDDGDDDDASVEMGLVESDVKAEVKHLEESARGRETRPSDGARSMLFENGGEGYRIKRRLL